MADKARSRRRATNAFLYTVLILGSLPIVVPYLWLFTVAFSGRAGASTTVLWLTLAILMPALLGWLGLRASIEDPRRLRHADHAASRAGDDGILAAKGLGPDQSAG